MLKNKKILEYSGILEIVLHCIFKTQIVSERLYGSTAQFANSWHKLMKIDDVLGVEK